jgi:hypothetical protein
MDVSSWRVGKSRNPENAAALAIFTGTVAMQGRDGEQQSGAFRNYSRLRFEVRREATRGSPSICRRPNWKSISDG